MTWRGMTPEERFWKATPIGTREACWEWQGHRVRDEYGSLKLDGKAIRVHRYSWILHNGQIPDGLFVLHRCDNPPCVNPDHLFLGTQSDNMLDMSLKQRNTRARLSTDEVLMIRDSCEIQQILADRYGVAQSTISKIKLRKRWRHLA